MVFVGHTAVPRLKGVTAYVWVLEQASVDSSATVH